MNVMKRPRRDNQEGRTKPSAPPPIGFRLDVDSLRLLTEKAARSNVSVHELARTYVLEMLHMSEQIDRVGFAITNVWDDLYELREDLALSVQTLLVSAGKINRAEAEAWVDNNLKPKCSQSPDQCGAPAAPTTT